MTPTGSFCTPLDPLAQKHYVGDRGRQRNHAGAVDSETTMEIETESRFTLIYGNRTKDSTMFRHELDELESRYADRLEILHVLSSDPRHTPELRGQIDDEKLQRWLTSSLRPETVDEWFLCGPIDHDRCGPRHADRPRRRRASTSTWSCSPATPKPKHPRGITNPPPSPSQLSGRAGDARPRRRRLDPRRCTADSPRRALLLHGRRVRHLPGEAG